MTTDQVEKLLRLWGFRFFQAEYRSLGYSQQPLSKLLGKPGSDIPDELYLIDEAIVQLYDADAYTGKIIVDTYGHELAQEKVARRNPEPITGKTIHRNTVGRRVEAGLFWIAGYLHNELKKD